MTEEKHKKILLVDDDDDTRETYSELFLQNGFQIIEAHDGIEGLDIATSRDGIDLIFTGITMPRMDGFQLIEALKKNTVTANIPVLINSHLGREEDRLRAMELGARDFIIRGLVPPAEIVKRISQALSVGAREYTLKVDPYEYDGQMLVGDLKLPEDFICKNCGTQLALKLSNFKDGNFQAQVLCPNCKKSY